MSSQNMTEQDLINLARCIADESDGDQTININWEKSPHVHRRGTYKHESEGAMVILWLFLALAVTACAFVWPAKTIAAVCLLIFIIGGML